MRKSISFNLIAEIFLRLKGLIYTLENLVHNSFRSSWMENLFINFVLTVLPMKIDYLKFWQLWNSLMNKIQVKEHWWFTKNCSGFPFTPAGFLSTKAPKRSMHESLTYSCLWVVLCLICLFFVSLFVPKGYYGILKVENNGKLIKKQNKKGGLENLILWDFLEQSNSRDRLLEAWLALTIG